MRILLTAYGPFGKVKENITERVADAIEKSWDHEGGKLVVRKLPVEWQGAEQTLTHTLQEFKPDVMVAMGHAENYPTIAVETRYFNIAEGEDNKGEIRAGGVIYPDTEDLYDTNINIDLLAQCLTGKNIPAMLHAGKEGMTYLCNFAGYVVMRHIRRRRKKKPLFIFLHLPPESTLPFPVLVQSVTTIIRSLVLQARQ